MDRLELVIPNRTHEAAAREYILEHIEQGETVLHGAAGLERDPSYVEWLERLKVNSDEKTVLPGYVAATTFFAIRPGDGRIVGTIQIRHRLNEFLRSYGGHIGYGVRPSERNKGYATQMLTLALAYARQIGLTKVMLACNRDNEASRRTILKCNGVLEREFLHTDGKMVQVYWITIG
ncbi:predicted acetyltransferase [Longilinea arvoryzae]|uniref:Predicted acetyltransferase n=1 Tax=Longilinea arvoryzae TaxID=360412 RepID=A0A0S7BFK4_9CHLR|nr:GNAT family N-acetyltransferase [Longilinea arvoryzae]GAP13363.1 predicted acetyltransferase [Longilinea arvoryzae]